MSSRVLSILLSIFLYPETERDLSRKLQQVGGRGGSGTPAWLLAFDTVEPGWRSCPWVLTEERYPGQQGPAGSLVHPGVQTRPNVCSHSGTSTVSGWPLVMSWGMTAVGSFP